METAELNLYNDLKSGLHLTDEDTVQVVLAIEKYKKASSDSLLGEFKSLFKEDFHRLELKLEQQNTKLEQFKAELYFKFEQFKLEIDSKFKEQDAKLEQFKAEIISKFDKHKSEIDLKFKEQDTKFEQFKLEIDLKFKEQETNLEKFKAEINSKIGDTKDKLTNLFITGFITVTVMILGLFATIFFKFLI